MYKETSRLYPYILAFAIIGMLYALGLQTLAIPKLEDKVSELHQVIDDKDTALREKWLEIDTMKVESIEAYRALSQRNEQLEHQLNTMLESGDMDEVATSEE